MSQNKSSSLIYLKNTGGATAAKLLVLSVDCILGLVLCCILLSAIKVWVLIGVKSMRGAAEDVLLSSSNCSELRVVAKEV